jgi:hypothetical protein
LVGRETHEGYTLHVLSIVTGPKWSLAPLFIASPVTGNCHLVREVNCGIPCVCTVGLRGFHRWEESTLVPLCWSTEKTIDFSSLSVDRGDRYGMSGILWVVMDWWCIVDRVDYWLAPLTV